MTAPSEMLVVSDLHLHERSLPEEAVDFARLLERPASLLVINGDLFDLDRVAGERRAGEGLDPAGARLQRILEHFPQIGEALRSFAGRGGQVVWLPGNHDAEISQPALQRILRRRLDLPEGALRFSGEIFQSSDVHVEHGHQLDPDNAFYPDTSSAASKGRLSAFPLGCLMTRFLLCRIPKFRNRGDNQHTPLQVLLRVLRDFGWSTPRMIALYVLAGIRITLEAWRARSRGDAPPDPAATMASPWTAIRRLYLDRIAALVVLAIVLLTALWPAPVLTPPVALGTGLPLAALLLVPPLRNRRYRQRENEACRQAARRLFSEGQRVVIMGHTHRHDHLTLGPATYLNPGSFDEPQPEGRPFAVVDGDGVRLDWLPPAR